MMKHKRYKSWGIVLTYVLLNISRPICSANITSQQDAVSAILSPPQRMWDPEKGQIIGLTENPQQMWDPEKGSVLGKNVKGFYRESNISTNKTVQLGSNVFLDCQVRNMADKKVSWIRRRDNHILTSGLQPYTNDQRFSVVREEGSDNWALLIRYVQKRDQGRYECQVSTKTGRYGYNVDLHVVIPKATIVGSSELHVQSGSTISLVCIIKNILTPPHFIFWYHNTNVINHEAELRGDVTIHTELSPTPTSRLIITGASYDDSGNYTCVLTDSDPATVNVFVSEGDKTAAIQRLGSAGTTFCCQSFIYILPFVANYFIVNHCLLGVRGSTGPET